VSARSLVTCALVALASPLLAADRETKQLLDGWEFSQRSGTLKEASAFEYHAVRLPHTWNAQDMQMGSAFYEGQAWYRRNLRLSTDQKKRKVFLRFEGVGQVAQVYVNGRLVGEHKGGYSAFCFEITSALKFGENNLIQVSVDNEHRKDVIPINQFLFGVYGGIYRPVSLILTDPIRVTPTDYASSGVYLTPSNVNAEGAELDVLTKVINGENAASQVIVRTTLFDREGTAVAKRDDRLTLGYNFETPVRQRLHVSRPHLWNALKDPYLYRARVEILKDGVRHDSVDQPVGFRSFRIDADRGFILNSRPYRLYGVCRHQDWQEMGSAITDTQHRQDMEMIREIGATSIRLAHYQQAETIYSLADQMGFVIWAEVPFVNAWSGEERENALQQIRELIRQNYNHPSIFFWGLHNEVYSKYSTDFPVLLTQEMHNLAKAEDPTRLTVSTTGYGDFNRAMDYHADLQGVNRYLGWYGGKVTDLEGWIETTKKQRPGTRFAIAEYGAEANVNQQSEKLLFDFDPTNGQFFPENYQTYFHEVQWAAIKKHPEIWASYVWNMFDFAVPMWSRGGIPARNMKGLVTFDRKIKKDAFYWYKANWSKDPVLYLVGRRLKERTQSLVDVEVYSNVGACQLELNGKVMPPPSLGYTPVHYVFKGISLSLGRNVLKVSVRRDGQEYTDSVEWDLRAAH